MDFTQSDPLVSVIIPAYNHEQYVGACLESVIKQSYRNIQIIVINDGSTDNTEGKILSLIQNSERNISYISKENEGVCKTLNLGLSIAKGKYIAFLASDDMWAHNRIEKQVCFLEKNSSVGFIFSDSKFVFNEVVSNSRYSDYKLVLNKIFSEPYTIKNIYYDLILENFISAITVLVRKKCIDEVGIFDSNIAFEDYDMWLRLSKKFPVAYIPETLALYRIHTTNISHDTKLMLRGTFQTIMKQYKEEPLRGKPLQITTLSCKLIFNLLRNRIKRFFIKRNSAERVIE
jgi:alpha-1,3-rhamnosyltransferase